MLSPAFIRRLNNLKTKPAAIQFGELVYVSAYRKDLTDIASDLSMEEVMSSEVSKYPNSKGNYELWIKSRKDIEFLAKLKVIAAETALKNLVMLEVFADFNQFDWLPLGKGEMQLVPRNIATGTGYVKTRLGMLGIDESYAVTRGDKTVITKAGCRELADRGYSPSHTALNTQSPAAQVPYEKRSSLAQLELQNWKKSGDKFIIDNHFETQSGAKNYLNILRSAGADDPRVMPVEGRKWAVYVLKEDAVTLALSGIAKLAKHIPSEELEKTRDF